jgi:putative intracellular protease/amidase
MTARQSAINYYKRKGLTQEEAEARYDRPKGTCKVCGGPAATARAEHCQPCRDDIERRRGREAYHARKADHARARRAAAGKPGRSAAKRGRGESIRILPRSENSSAPPREEIIIVPEGMTVTKLPSILPPTIRGAERETWDDDPKKAAFIDAVLAKRRGAGKPPVKPLGLQAVITDAPGAMGER